VLVRAGSFRALSFPEFYNRTRRIAWEHWVGMSPTVAFEVSAKRSRLMHERRTQQTACEAVVSVMAALGRVVALDPDSPVRVHIRIWHDWCTMSVDCTGQNLHMRGYRVAPVASPIRESTAAGLLMASGFAAFPAVVDPMCGSGTLLIEAARMLRGIPPGAQRSFAFEQAPWCSGPRWQRLRRETLASARAETGVALAGYDIDPRAVAAAGKNAAEAGVGGSVVFAEADARTIARAATGAAPGLLISNLPYGKRVGDSAGVGDLYRAFGCHMREEFAGWHFGFVVPRGAESLLGLRIRDSLKFVNGGIPVVFVTGKVC